MNERLNWVPTFEFSPSLLVIVCSPFQKSQITRTPGAAVSFDTTYNITADGIKLSMFVVKSPSLQGRFFPVMHCLHRSLDADVYQRIFTTFFSCFGMFGIEGNKFCGITFDFADAICEGYLTAVSNLPDAASLVPLEHVRMCKFHFMKNLVALIRNAGIPDDKQGALILLARKMLGAAAEAGVKSPPFRASQASLFSALSEHSGFDSWLAWWVEGSGGRHWACLTDVGPGTIRHRLHDTTNSSESQNRVVKEDHELSDLPGLALLELFKMQDEKNRQYEQALKGMRPSGMREPKEDRNPHKAIARPDGVPSSRGRKAEIGQGPPKTVSAYKQYVKNEAKTVVKPKSKSLSLKYLSAKSFPIWNWSRNSCSYDSVLSLGMCEGVI